MERTSAPEAAMEVDRAYRRLGGMSAGVLIVACGLIVVVDGLWPSGRPDAVVAGLAIVGGVVVATGAVVLRLPWQRWPAQALLGIVPPVLGLVTAFNQVARNPHLGALFFVMTAMWLGIAQPRGTALALSPLLGAAYWASMTLSGNRAGLLEALPYVTAACALGGETLAWQTAQARRRLWEHGERRFQALLAGSSETTIVLDVAGRVTYASPSAGRVLGLAAGQLEGLDIPTLATRHVHPEDAARLVAGIRRLSGRGSDHEVIEFRVRQPDGSWLDVEGLGRNLLGDAAVQGVLLNLRDVGERKQLERALTHQAFHDQLTGLANRALLHDRTTQAIRQANRELVPAALLLLDLDRFKEVNDTLGHHAGDHLLHQVSERLRAALREVDTVARLGGDEFAVLLPRAPTAEGAMAVAAKLRAALATPFDLDGLALDVEASIGVALYPDHADGPDQLLQHADIAMYTAKQTHAGFALFDASLDQHSPYRLALLGQLRRAIDDQQLVVHYQPKVEAASSRILGAEALVRWQHPDYGLIPPDEFIPLAERTGLIAPLTHWVLDAALRQCHQWRAAGVELPVAVNVSTRRLLDPQFPDEVASLLATWQVPAAWLVLEITESAIMADPARALELLGRLDAMGVQLSIDDFGTGYSSMAYLKQLPVHELKIDRSFVTHLTTDHRDAVIVRSTIDLGRNLGLRVVAEGVEDEATRNDLHSLGCDAIQGYHISRPMPAHDLTAWLNSWQPADHGSGGPGVGDGTGPGAPVASG